MVAPRQVLARAGRGVRLSGWVLPAAACRRRVPGESHGGFRLQASRPFLSALRPVTLSAEAVLDQARVSSTDLGFDPSELYEPWMPVDLGQQLLLNLHGLVGSSGLAVAAAALLLRLATLPWNQRALQLSCDRLVLAPYYMDIAKALQKAQAERIRLSRGHIHAASHAEKTVLAEVACQKYAAMMETFSKEAKFAPTQGLGYQFGVLMPCYIAGYFTLRGIVAHPDTFRSFVVEPAFWLDSLVLPDPVGLLPAISGALVLINLEVNSPVARPGQEDNALYMRLVVRGAALAFAPVTTLLPSAILVFMATNAAYTATITWAFKRFLWKRPEIKPHWVLSDAVRATK